MSGDAPPPTTGTVEQVVREQLSDALGGARGMLEAAVPTVVFTVVFLTRHDLRLAIVAQPRRRRRCCSSYASCSARR